MNVHKQCLICEGERLTELNTYKSTYLCKCLSCGFVFSRRVPTKDELNEHYMGYGRNDYLSPVTIKRYNELLDRFEKYRKTNRILDVGCGIGYFLEEAKKRNWEVYGTEYTDVAVEICKNKGISMQNGVLDPSHYDTESFDVITSFEVIEHINNPKEELASFYRLLRKGGAVYVTTPNFNSLLRYRLKETYDMICYPEHLSYYTPKTLRHVFRKAGFASGKIETTGISLTRLRRGKGVSDQQIISPTSDDEKLRVEIEQKKHLQLAKKIINATLTFLGTGDSLKGLFVK